ncbi:MAG TPA: hypothetical protein VHD83_00935 [Puia sp.]|nr:hypothetical protein [Puia sp.]
MGFWDIFKKKEPHNPEEDYKIAITESAVSVVLPDGKTMEIEWDKIQVIALSNTDQGPWQPDIWLIMAGEGQGVIFPHGAKGFDEVIERVSKFEGFDHHAIGLSMCCAENAEFILWGNRANLTGFK